MILIAGLVPVRLPNEDAKGVAVLLPNEPLNVMRYGEAAVPDPMTLTNGIGLDRPATPVGLAIEVSAFKAVCT